MAGRADHDAGRIRRAPGTLTEASEPVSLHKESFDPWHRARARSHTWSPPKSKYFEKYFLRLFLIEQDVK